MDLAARGVGQSGVFRATGATKTRHRFEMGGRVVEVDVIVCPAEDWYRRDESTASGWNVVRLGEMVRAVRLVV